MAGDPLNLASMMTVPTPTFQNLGAPLRFTTGGTSANVMPGPVAQGLQLMSWLTDSGMAASGFISVAELQPLLLPDLQDFDFELPPDTFVYSDPTEPLRYTARATRGGALPAWLHFDPLRLRFSGNAPPGVTQLDVIVAAYDRQNHRAQALMTLDFH